IGVAAWPETLFGVASLGIGLFLLNIFFTTHMDKVFNWIFRLCPRRFQPWIAHILDDKIDSWDQRMTAQDTFGKRFGWATFRLAIWTGYLVLAFGTLQTAWNFVSKQPSEHVGHLLLTLLIQAVLNIPSIAFLLIRIFG